MFYVSLNIILPNFYIVGNLLCVLNSPPIPFRWFLVNNAVYEPGHCTTAF